MFPGRLLLAFIMLVLAAPALAVERWRYGDVAEAAFRSGDYPAALDALRTELTKCDAAGPQGDQCLDLLLALSNVAVLTDDAALGESFARRALAVAVRMLPAKHPDIASSWDNLASNLNAQGRYAEAEVRYRRALEMREATLPAGHPDIAMSWNNLAFNLSVMGNDAEAEPLYRRALTMFEAALPAGHPSIATNLNNLALNLNAQERYAEAEPLYRRALAICEKALPASHPDLIDAYFALGSQMQRLRGSSIESRALFRRAHAGALERMRSYLGFTQTAQTEIRKYRPIFIARVGAAWNLAAGR